MVNELARIQARHPNIAQDALFDVVTPGGVNR